jgi:hypothetical protein
MNRCALCCIALSLFACEDEVVPACSKARQELTTDARQPLVGLVIPAGIPTGDTVITGNLYRPDGLAVRRVFVDGLSADNKGADFSHFAVTVPLATLKANAGKVDVVVETNCPDLDDKYRKTETIALTPVGATALTLDIESGALPTTRQASKSITITTDRALVGGTVSLSTTLGVFDGGMTTTTRALVDDGTNATAYASLLALPPEKNALPAGTATIIATAGGITKTDSVTFVPPPRLLPATLALTQTATSSIDLVDVTGTVTCSLSASAGITAVLGSAPITNTPQPATMNAQVIVTANNAPLGSSATLTCIDPLGQIATTTISVPKPP